MSQGLLRFGADSRIDTLVWARGLVGSVEHLKGRARVSPTTLRDGIEQSNRMAADRAAIAYLFRFHPGYWPAIPHETAAKNPADLRED